MIKTFKQFYEALTSGDMKNAIDLTIQKQDAIKQNPNQQQQPKQPQNATVQKQANIKVTDLQKRIDALTQQKQQIANEVEQLTAAQRDLAPTDSNQLKVFNQQQEAQIKSKQNLLNALDQEIKNIQNSIATNKQTYLGK